jgi:hypothetical protein
MSRPFTIAYHFNEVAQFAFDPPLLYRTTLWEKSFTNNPSTEGPCTLRYIRGEDLARLGWEGYPGSVDSNARRREVVKLYEPGRVWRNLYVPPPPDFVPIEPWPDEVPPEIVNFVAAPEGRDLVLIYEVRDDIEASPTVRIELVEANEIIDRRLDLPRIGTVSFPQLFLGADYQTTLFVDDRVNTTQRTLFLWMPPEIRDFKAFTVRSGTIAISCERGS